MYVIANWEIHFENNRTRNRKTIHWVPFPNTHDGAGYAELLDHHDGPAHYGTWCAIVQLASRCQPRGKLIRSNGQPHDSVSLSRVIKFPTKTIEAAMNRFVTIGWMKIEVYDGEVIPKASAPAAPEPKGKKEVDPAASIPVMSFPCTGDKEWNLTLKKLSEYENSFPGVDVMQECRVARQWCIDNPIRRKTPSGMARFLTSWMTRKQNQGGGKSSRSSDPRGTMAAGVDFLKSRGIENGKV